MKKLLRKICGTAALAFLLCLTGLVMSGEARAQRFTDNGNGTVTDTVTGLMWTKDANLFGRLTWHGVLSRCSSFSISGIGGWRLPNKDELVVLYHAIQGGHPFTGVQSSFYWTGPVHTYPAWFVRMSDGGVITGNRAGTTYVWPVRGPQ